MIPPAPHIQERLDRDFHGVQLDFNEQLSVWVVTDYGYFPNGAPAQDEAIRSGHYLKGIAHTPASTRRCCFALVDHETGQRWEPSLDTLLPVLYRTYNGAKADARNEFVDYLEETEDAEHKAAVNENRSAAREAARSAFDRHIGKGHYSSAGAVTAKGVERAIDQKMREATLLQAGPQADDARLELERRLNGV